MTGNILILTDVDDENGIVTMTTWWCCRFWCGV